MLSKTKFLSGLQCQKKLWMEIHSSELATPPSETTERMFSFGHDVGARAQAYFGEGRLVDRWPIEDAANDTVEAIENGFRFIYEATFISSGRVVKVDVLEILDAKEKRVRIVEVKASNSVKDEHINDVAFQRAVLTDLGYVVDSCAIMHLNHSCMDPDSRDLLIEVNVTERAMAAERMVRSTYPQLLDLWEKEDKPDVGIGSHCSKPYECAFKDHCWADVPENSVFNIPNLKMETSAALYEEGIHSAAEAEKHVSLSDKQGLYVNAVKAGKPIINQEAAREFLDSLEYPIHFLDFEADALPINRFKNIGPWRQFPFQFCCATMEENGMIDVLDFVHPNLSDPRENFVENLVDEIGLSGSVVVHNASYEKTRLEEMAQLFPQHGEKIRSIIQRLRDTEVGLRQSIVHPGFKGSYSLKAVIPVLVTCPILLDYVGYEGLGIQDGRQAGAVWDKYVHSTDEDERGRLLLHLWTYCRQDTLGMVEIVEVMRSWLGGNE